MSSSRGTYSIRVAEIGIIEWPYVWSTPMFTMYMSSVLRAHRLDLVCSSGACKYSRDFSHRG